MQLAKQQTLNLAKAAQLITLHFGTNWGMIEKSGFLGMGKSKQDVDLDASAIMLNDMGATVGTPVYFGNLRSVGINHSGDDLTGDAEADNSDNEIITVDLSKIPANVESVIFTLNSFSGQKFDDIPYAAIRVYEGQPNRPTEVKATFNLANDASFKGATSIVVGKLYRSNNGWDFKAIGDASGHTRLNGLIQEAKKYA